MRRCTVPSVSLLSRRRVGETALPLATRFLSTHQIERQSLDRSLALRRERLFLCHRHDAYFSFALLQQRFNSSNTSAPEFRALERGLRAFQRGQYDLAIKEYSEVIRMSSSDPRGWGGRAEAFEAIGKYDDAESDYEKVVTITPEHLPSYCGIARCKMMRGHLDDALRQYNTVLYGDTRFGQAYGGRGEVYMRMGRVEEAVSDFHRFAQLSPDIPDPHVLLGGAALQQGQIEQAEEHYRSALQVEPTCQGANAGLGSIEYARRNFEGAHHHWSIALGGDESQSVPADPHLLLDLFIKRASARLALGRVDGALEDCKEALLVNQDEQNPLLYKVWLVQGQCYTIKEDFDEAARCFSGYLQATRVSSNSSVPSLRKADPDLTAQRAQVQIRRALCLLEQFRQQWRGPLRDTPSNTQAKPNVNQLLDRLARFTDKHGEKGELLRIAVSDCLEAAEKSSMVEEEAVQVLSRVVALVGRLPED